MKFLNIITLAALTSNAVVVHSAIPGVSDIVKYAIPGVSDIAKVIHSKCRDLPIIFTSVQR